MPITPTKKEAQIYLENVIETCDNALKKLPKVEKNYLDNMIFDGIHHRDPQCEALEKRFTKLKAQATTMHKAHDKDISTLQETARKLEIDVSWLDYHELQHYHEIHLNSKYMGPREQRYITSQHGVGDILVHAETPLEARERHLENIKHAIQAFEERLIHAGATSSTKNTPKQMALNQLLSQVKFFKNQWHHAEPQDNKSMEEFASQCHTFVEKTMDAFATDKHDIANYKTAYDHLIECINPLLEKFGYQPFKTTLFKDTLADLKQQAGFIQEQDNKTLK
jgi:hypothetical protein